MVLCSKIVSLLGFEPRVVRFLGGCPSKLWALGTFGPNGFSNEAVCRGGAIVVLTCKVKKFQASTLSGYPIPRLNPRLNPLNTQIPPLNFCTEKILVKVRW